MPRFDGFLNVRKPRDISSAGVVDKIRRVFGVPCGHAGTLDPLAEGVLIIGVGEARKFIRFLKDDKEYEAVMRLGQESDTLDSTGKLSAPVPVAVSEAQIRDAGRKLEGEIDMPAPKYSAIRVGGRRLYEMAREGKEVSPPSRRSMIYSVRVEAVHLPDVKFRVICSGGTYVRSLAEKWGRMLGCGAHLAGLVRLRSGCFELVDSRPVEEIEALLREGAIGGIFVSARAALAHLPEMTADRSIALNGRPLPFPPALKAAGGEAVRLIDAGGSFIGMGRVAAGSDGALFIHPERMSAPAGESP